MKIASTLCAVAATSALLAASTAPAHAIEPTELQTPFDSTQDVTENGGVVYRAEIHESSDQLTATVSLIGGTMKQTDSGNIRIINSFGETVDELSMESLESLVGSEVTNIEVLSPQEISVSFESAPHSVALKPMVDQSCAATNVFWGAAVGGANGIVGGIPGVVAGSMAGLLVAGVQSAIHC